MRRNADDSAEYMNRQRSTKDMTFSNYFVDTKPISMGEKMRSTSFNGRSLNYLRIRIINFRKIQQPLQINLSDNENLINAENKSLTHTDGREERFRCRRRE